MQDEYISPADELSVARNVIRVHRSRSCQVCTEDGCPAMEWAATLVFDAATFGAIVGVELVPEIPPGRKSTEDVRRVADELGGG
jgi:hypothetical protein